MAREDDEQPCFVFKKLLGVENYKEWARQMRYSLKSSGLWIHIILVAENPKPAPTLLKKEDKLDDAKVERQEQQTEKTLAWTRSNSRCRGYIGRMCTPHIQQEIQAVNTDWLAEDLWKWLKERYTLQNTASKWATIVHGRPILCQLQEYGRIPVKVLRIEGKYNGAEYHDRGCSRDSDAE